MDYPLENLGPEKFQQFCQSLLVKSFQDVQCFPVAQPDGGRDSTCFFKKGMEDNFIIFQVKFVRKPFAEQDPHKWLTDILKEEAPKVEKLIPRGASAFYLLTNIPGTAHLDSGSIDQVNSIFKSYITIESHCWWRDDVCRRLDSEWDLKWVYPELMTGPDLIRAIVESGLTEQKEQRVSAIRAFLKDQYSIDQEVRFKQVELQNRLLDLFIDVPVFYNHQSRHRQHYLHYQIAETIAHELPNNGDDDFDNQDLFGPNMPFGEAIAFRDRKFIGAATLLLHPLGQSDIPRMVIEGAPGQGKSTITQYVCQIHRMRILNNKTDLSLTPDNHKCGPVRIPFKIDLRDLSTWLGKQDPFSAQESEEVPAHWHKSLESFLAAQVRHHSGGANFVYEDLIAVFKLSSVLLVFDGLDEIADISKRKDVVEEIIKGVNRLEENAASLQVVVTSRPAAFANSPGLPDDEFPYYNLGSVTRPLIQKYAESWLKVRKIQGRQRVEFNKILKNKLDEPHLRELARNPMQLAILLSLIHTRGASLPDKRTALYDSYVELFFSREAEKSSVVREYRDLLIDIHRYLAWVLHSEAEEGHDRGSITTERLKTLLSEYLYQEGHNTSIAEELFTGMVERVVALVSRVEGTFEFEVQPLREYFAARYLYETAPYSPPGSEKKGTKPDRFDAIARDFYWLNVTRFYAGCFSKGELPSLVDRLQELVNEEGYNLISHPRVLAATLLSDWVFSQHPKSVKEVVRLILDGIGLRYALNSIGNQRWSGGPIILPNNCGKDELMDRCFSILQTYPSVDYAMEIIDLINNNSTQSEILNLWQTKMPNKRKDQTNWISYGLRMGVLSKISLSDLSDIISNAPYDHERLNIVFKARRFDYLERSEECQKSVIDAILSCKIEPRRRMNKSIQSYIELFNYAIDPYRYSVAFKLKQPVPLSDIWKGNTRFQVDSIQKEPLSTTVKTKTSELCYRVIEVARNECHRTAADWASEIEPWDRIVESARAVFGDRWALYLMANVSAGIKSQKETCIDFHELIDSTVSLCRRVRYARLRAGNVRWWLRQISSAKSKNDVMLILLVLLSWGSPTTLIALLKKIEELLERIDDDEWSTIIESVKQTMDFAHGDLGESFLQFDLSKLPEKISARTATAFGIRAKKENREVFYKKYLLEYKGKDYQIIKFCSEEALDRSNLGNESWSPNLDMIAMGYEKGIIADFYFHHGLPTYRRRFRSIPIKVAKEIASKPDKYPSYLVAFAESTYREVIASKIIPVGSIAKRDGWFVI